MDIEYTANSICATHCPSSGLVNWEINIRYLLKPSMDIISGKVLVPFWQTADNISQDICVL